jgi:hypothetical protein
MTSSIHLPFPHQEQISGEGTPEKTGLWGKVKGKVKSEVKGIFNKAVDDIKTTDSKFLQIVKIVGYVLVAATLIGLLATLSGLVAYFATPALYAVFVMVMLIGSIMIAVAGIKAIIKVATFSVATYRQHKAENAQPGDPAQQTDQTGSTAAAATAQAGGISATSAVSGSVAIPTGSPPTDGALVNSTATSTVDVAGEAGKTVESHASGKVMTFLKKHWKAILTAVLVVLVVAICVASGGITFGFLLIVAVLAGSYGIAKGIEAGAGKIHDFFADRKEVSEMVEKGLQAFKDEKGIVDDSAPEDKILLEKKREELEGAAQKEVAEKRAHTNQFKEIKSKHGVDDARAEEMLKAQEEHDEPLQKQIDEINDEEGLNISPEDIKKQLKKDVGETDYHTRLKKALIDKGNDMTAAKGQLEQEDQTALNTVKRELCEKREKSDEMSEIRSKYSLPADSGKNDFIAKQLLIEKNRQQKWLIEQNAAMAKVRGGKGVWAMGIIGPNFAKKAISDSNGSEWDHLGEYKNALSEKMEGSSELQSRDITGIRKDLRAKTQKIIDADKDAYRRENVHKHQLTEKVDEINLKYGTKIGHSAARKEIESQKGGTYHVRWEAALKTANGDTANAQKALDQEDDAVLEGLARTACEKREPQEKIDSIARSHNVDGDFAKEILREIHRHEVWVKQQAKETGLSESEIQELTAQNHLDNFKAKVTAHMDGTNKLSLDKAVEEARKEIYGEYKPLVQAKKDQVTDGVRGAYNKFRRFITR